MAVSNGMLANAGNFNTFLASRTVDNTIAGRYDFVNVNAESGPFVVNIQREINSLNAFSGHPLGADSDATPIWNSNVIGTTINTLKERIEAIDNEFLDLRPYIIDATVLERGLVNTIAQSFAGSKTFASGADINSFLNINGIANFLLEADNSSGSNVELVVPSSSLVTLNNAGLVSIGSIQKSSNNTLLILINNTANNITLINNYSGAVNPDDAIFTMSGQNQTFRPNSVMILMNRAGFGWYCLTEDAYNAPTWLKYTIGFADISAAATTNTITLFSLLSLGMVEACVIKHSQAFTGGSISALTLDIGVTGEEDRYIIDFDGFQAPSASAFQAESFNLDVRSFTANTNIVLRADSVGANLSALTQGSVDIWIKRSFLR